MNEEQIIELNSKIEKKYKKISGIVIMKDAELIYENYFNECDAHSKLHVYSVTKSIISILIGIAIDQGYIRSIDEKIISFYPDYTINKKENSIQNITIKDMLTMKACFKYKIPPYIKYFKSDDWVNFSLDLLGGKKPTEDFRYTPLIGPDILSGIIVNATGQSVLDFANDNLFKPLDISVKNNITFSSKKEQMNFNKATNINGWVMDSKNVHAAGWGLTLSAMDMAKIGQLYLNQGIWNNRQIVSSDWIIESTKEQNVWKKMNLSYGYLWWVVKEQGFAAMGDGGNIIYVNIKKNLVVAINALFVLKADDHLSFIKTYIEPLLESE